MMAVAEQQYPQLDMNSVRESVKRFNLAKVGREFDFVPESPALALGFLQLAVRRSLLPALEQGEPRPFDQVRELRWPM